MNNMKAEVSFEKKLEMLESLVTKMGEGGSDLEELLKEYELGVKLAQELNADLEKAQAKLLSLKGGVLKPMDNADAV